MNLPNGVQIVKAVYSLGSLYYSDAPLTDLTKFTMLHQWDAPATSPRWKDGFQVSIAYFLMLTKKSFDPEFIDFDSCKILIINLLNIWNWDKNLPPHMASLGWTVIPLFTDDSTSEEAYVRSGKFIVPLFTSELTKVCQVHLILMENKEIVQILDSENFEVVRKIYANKLKQDDTMAVMVRILESHRTGELETDVGDMNTYTPLFFKRKKYKKKQTSMKLHELVEQISGPKDLKQLTDKLNEFVSEVCFFSQCRFLNI